MRLARCVVGGRVLRRWAFDSGWEHRRWRVGQAPPLGANGKDQLLGQEELSC